MSNNGLYTPPPGRRRSTPPAPGLRPREARSAINQQNAFAFRERLKADPEFHRQWRDKISATQRARYAELAITTPSASWPDKTPEAKEKWRRSITAGRQAAIRAARKAARRRTDDETGDYIWMEANDYAKKSGLGYAGAMARMVRYEWKKEQRPGRTWIFRVPTIYDDQPTLPAPVATVAAVAAIEPSPRRRWWSWLRFWR